MSRQARLDAPGTLHHVRGRGIEWTKIFWNKGDRTDFLQRLAELCQDGGLILYAWALMSNHFHILVRQPDPVPKHEAASYWLCHQL